MSKKESALAIEVRALLRQERRDTAARLLATAFVPVIDDPYPLMTGARLGESLARDAGMRVCNWAWSISRDSDATLSRLILELVLLRERAGLACRGLARDANEVVLPARGEESSRAGGVDAVRRALT